jgi:hypothetical protein
MRSRKVRAARPNIATLGALNPERKIANTETTRAHKNIHLKTPHRSANLIASLSSESLLDQLNWPDIFVPCVEDVVNRSRNHHSAVDNYIPIHRACHNRHTDREEAHNEHDAEEEETHGIDGGAISSKTPAAGRELFAADAL